MRAFDLKLGLSMGKPSRDLVGQFIDAAVDDHKRALQLLSQHPELIHARWFHEETALHFLAVENYVAGVRFLAEHGADLNTPNGFGDPPLIDVARLGNDIIAELLLAYGADPNAVSKTYNNVLDCAVASGNVRLVQLLLEAGADPNVEFPIGGNVLHRAVALGSARMVCLLLEAGADPNYQTVLDETVIDALPGDPACRQMLVAILREFGFVSGTVESG